MNTSRRPIVPAVVLAVAALILAAAPAAAGDPHCVASSNGWMNCLIESDPTDIALSGQVTIPAGATSATIAVVPINDAYIESEETVVVTLAPSPSYAVGVTSRATVTIVSDDR